MLLFGYGVIPWLDFHIILLTDEMVLVWRDFDSIEHVHDRVSWASSGLPVGIASHSPRALLRVLTCGNKALGTR